ITWWIELPQIDLIDLYWQVGGKWQQQRTGSWVPGNEKINRNGYRELGKIELAPKEERFLYVRFEEKEKSAPSIFFFFREDKAHRLDSMSTMANSLISNGVFVGILTIIALYHLMLFFSTRERAYLFFTLYMLSVDFVFIIDGIFAPYTSVGLAAIEMYYIIYWLVGLISVFYYLFAQSYLKTAERLPVWHRYIYFFIGLKVVLVFTGHVLRLWTAIPEAALYAQNAVFLLDVPFLLGLSAALVNHKVPSRTYFIIGSLLVFCVGFIALGFKRYLPFNPILIFLISFLGHILVYSLGLGNRIRKDQQEKLAAQSALNEELQKINQATARFVPHEFLRSLGRNSVLDVALGDGVEKEVSVLFADIRGYTS
ncbi:MAG: 7TM-DISM domain-containing protein, partial [Bacteroidota bacterium]